MQKLTPIVAMVAVAMLVGCKKKPSGKSKSGAETTEMTATPKESKKLECKQKYSKKFANGKFHWCTLAEDYTTGGITCKKGKVIRFHKKNHKLDECTLAALQTIEGHKCAVNRVELHASGKLEACYLHKPEKLNGVLCKGKTSFHRQNGRVGHCDLAEDMVVQGVPCKAGKTVSFEKGGKLWLCYTSKDITVGAAKIPSGVKVQPFGRKNIEYAEASSGKIIKFHAYKCKEMHFQQSGEAKKCKLASTVKIGDKEFPTNKWICFDKSGKPANGSGCEKL